MKIYFIIAKCAFSHVKTLHLILQSGIGDQAQWSWCEAKMGGKQIENYILHLPFQELGPSKILLCVVFDLSLTRVEQNGWSFHSYLKATCIQCNGLSAASRITMSDAASVHVTVCQPVPWPIKCIQGRRLYSLVWLEVYTGAPGVKTFSAASAPSSFSCLAPICVTSFLMWHV